MMHECKRLLNHSTGAEGLLVAHSSARPSKSTSMDAFHVPQHEDSDAGKDSAATEHTDTDADAECDAAALPFTTSDATVKKETCTQSFAHRDDWLHRGVLLQDMDYYHYTVHGKSREAKIRHRPELHAASRRVLSL